MHFSTTAFAKLHVNFLPIYYMLWRGSMCSKIIIITTLYSNFLWPDTLHKSSIYSQTRILCSRPICSLPGLQGQKPKAHYYFTFWDSTISVFMKFLWNQPVLSYSTHGSAENQLRTKKIAKKQFFRLNFEVLINSSLWNFTWTLQFAWI